VHLARGLARPRHRIQTIGRTVTLGLTTFGALTALASTVLDALPLAVWNAIVSAPIGLYLIRPGRELAVGDLVVLRLDPDTTAAFAQRGYLLLGVPLLMRVAALPRTWVCARDGSVFVGDRRVADAAPVDGAGRPLVAWHGCRALDDDAFFAECRRSGIARPTIFRAAAAARPDRRHGSPLGHRPTMSRRCRICASERPWLPDRRPSREPETSRRYAREPPQ
jgi:type IV secretory pathway protease TraF